MFRKSVFPPVVLAATLVLVGCGGDNIVKLPAPVLSNTVALTLGNRIISFNRTAPQTITSMSPVVTGLQTNETLLGIDYRPANGLLYAVGSSGAVYQLDPLSGVASNRVALISAAIDNSAITLSGTSFGVDFNPQSDRLRVVSNTGQNLRINLGLVNGNTTVDTPLLVSVAVSGSAYTNSFPGAVSTRLFSINLANNTLSEQGMLNPDTGTTQPNDGTQTIVAALGVTPVGVNGFDIDGRGNLGFAALTAGNGTLLYSINLSPAAGASAATAVGPIGDATQSILGLALAPVAAP
jgi:hypothetical protein